MIHNYELVELAQSWGLVAHAIGESMCEFAQSLGEVRPEFHFHEAYGLSFHVNSYKLPDGSMVYITDRLSAELNNAVWRVANNPCRRKGGASEFVFEYEFDDAEPLMRFVHGYYFGAPLKIGQWTIPIHRRLEWTADVGDVVASAPFISREEWDAIPDSQNGGADFQVLYSDDGESRLYLSDSGGEAYRIKPLTPSEIAKARRLRGL